MFLISQTLSVEYKDRSCLRIAAPPYNAVSYFSCYQQHNFIVTISYLVDGKKCFLDFASGFPGSIQDARVQQNSTILILILQALGFQISSVTHFRFHVK